MAIEIWSEVETRGPRNGEGRILPKGGIDVTPRFTENRVAVEDLAADYVVDGVRVVIENGAVKLSEVLVESGAEDGKNTLNQNGATPADYTSSENQRRMKEGVYCNDL